MDIKEKLRQIDVLTSELNECFDGYVNYNLVDMTDQYWTVFKEHTVQNEPYTKANEIGWSDENPMDIEDPDREHNYQEDVRFIIRKDKFTLVCVRLQDGIEEFVLDNSKEIPERELNP